MVFLVVLSSNLLKYLTKIVLKLYLKANLFLLISFLAVNFVVPNNLPAALFNYCTQLPDSVFLSTDLSILPSDTLSLPTDSLKKKSESPLDDPIFKNAKDSLLYSIDGKKVFLYGDAVVKYQKMELSAAYIEYDMESGVVFAEGRPDSTGTIVGKPVFKEGQKTFKMERMRYNFTTKKAKIYSVITEEADGFLHSQNTKLMPDKTINVEGGKYTTCDLEHPHYYISITKAKLIPNNKLITGPAYLVIADVPFPLVLPFGFFPSKRERSSGIKLPSYGEEQRRGFKLERGGYYFGISDYFDMEITGDIYSKGSWATYLKTNYRKRYRYSGSLSFDLSQFIQGEKGFNDYNKSNSYWLRWSHSQDSKANPNTTFSASVNLGSPSHNRLNPQGLENSQTTQMQSSVSFSKVWPGTPFSLSSSMNHSQNNRDSTISLGLPRISFNMNRIYPFKRKNNIGAPAWYEKIGLSYTGNLDNSVSTRTDSLFSLSTIDKMKNGVKHSIPISTSFNILNYITVSPSANYSENWYSKTIIKRWDSEKKKVVKEDVMGFKRAYQYNAAASMNTKLYGMYAFKSTSKVQAIRHVMNPSVSLSYRPDFGNESYGFYKNVQTDSAGTRFQHYSIFEGSQYGGPGSGESGTISLGLGNNIEMKVLSDKDSTSNTRIIKLIEGLNFNTGYNMLADSMGWSPVSMSAHTTLFEKFNINIGGTLDPYALDESGMRNKDFQFSINRHLFRLTSFRANVGFALTGGKKDPEGKGSRTASTGRGLAGDPSFNNGMDDPMFGDAISAGMLDGEYVDFDVPWNIRLDYSFSYNKQSFEPTTMQTLAFSGDLSLSPNWKVGFRSGYDFKGKKLTSTSLNFFRDLHCWEMSLSVIPFGYLRSFSFKINVRSSTLRDLQLTRNQSHYDR